MTDWLHGFAARNRGGLHRWSEAFGAANAGARCRTVAWHCWRLDWHGATCAGGFSHDISGGSLQKAAATIFDKQQKFQTPDWFVKVLPLFGLFVQDRIKKENTLLLARIADLETRMSEFQYCGVWHAQSPASPLIGRL